VEQEKDRGSESMHYQDIEQQLNISCYFAHPYASHEHGANENCNDLLRRYFPKKIDFTTITSKDLRTVEYLINSRPRKRIHGLTPYEYIFIRIGIVIWLQKWYNKFVMPTLRGDLEFLKNEGKKALGFSRGYVSDFVKDQKKTKIVKAIEYGPFNGLRLLLVIMGTISMVILFSLWRTEGSFWVALLIFLLLYGFVFKSVDGHNSGITGSILGFFGDVLAALIDIITGFGVAFFESLKELVIDIAGWLWQIVKDISVDFLDLIKDFFLMMKEIGVGILTDIGVMMKDIATDVLAMMKEIIVGLGVMSIEIIKEIITSCIEVVKDIFSSFGEMITDMLTFTKKES
jgi:hypothetical protein